MKYIVTGGAGFIGSHITSRLVAENAEVAVVDNLSTGSRENLRSVYRDVTFFEGDVRDLGLMQHIIEEGDVIFHQAALASVPRSIDDPLSTNDHNVAGTLTVLAAAQQRTAQRVVYAASSSAYGDSPVLPKVESAPANPLSPYAVSKYAGELYCRIFWSVYGLETVSLRYFNVFGPRQRPDAQYAAVIPRFISRMLSRQPPHIYGDGEQSRDFTFVDDVVTANLLAATARSVSGETINVGGGRQWSLNTLVDMLNHGLNTNMTPVHQPSRAGDVKHSMASIEKARLLLGYEPRTEFADGLARTIAWFKQSDWSQPVS